MFYYIKKEKINELKDGRTVTFIASILKLNYANLNLVFNGAKCKASLAMCLISVKEQIPVNSPDMNKYLEYYFKRKE